MRVPRTPSLLLLALVLSACHSTRGNLPPDLPSTPDVALSIPPFSDVHCSYKERLDQAYVYLELTGSYTLAGRSLADLAHKMQEQGLVASGPPFALFFDDPGVVPLEKLRAQVCFPVENAAAVQSPLRSDVLPGATVAYALASGRYPDVPRCYPGLLAYVKKMHWVLSGPIREIYLVEPGAVKSWSELRCEVQVPVGMAP